MPGDMRTGQFRDLAACKHAFGSKTNAWHEYVKEKDVQGRMADINAKRREFMALGPEEKQPYVDKAAKVRKETKARKAPVARALDEQLATELPGGPWSMSASKDALPGSWPLNRVLLCETLGQGGLASVATSWDDMKTKVWETAPEFPETVDMQEACKVDECLHAFTPAQAHRFATISKDFQLALRHSGLPAHCPLLFQLVCEPEVKYCLIGDHDWTHNLRCDIIIAKKCHKDLGARRHLSWGCRRKRPQARKKRSLARYVQKVGHQSGQKHSSLGVWFNCLPVLGISMLCPQSLSRHGLFL